MRPFTPGASIGNMQAPRIIRSIVTPCCAATIKAFTSTVSVSEFILATIFALPPNTQARLAAEI